jgi:hypothetical protein
MQLFEVSQFFHHFDDLLLPVHSKNALTIDWLKPKNPCQHDTLYYVLAP